MLRITSDIDSKSKLKLAHIFLKGLMNIEKIKLIEVTPSNSKGYHIIFWTTERYSLKEVFKIRKKIGDDPHRIRLDRKRKLGRQTLFNKKIKVEN